MFHTFDVYGTGVQVVWDEHHYHGVIDARKGNDPVQGVGVTATLTMPSLIGA